MSDEIKKGLLGIVVDETEVSKVMPEINSLKLYLKILKDFQKKLILWMLQELL